MQRPAMIGCLCTVIVTADDYIINLGGHRGPDQSILGAVQQRYPQTIGLYLTEVAQILSSNLSEVPNQAYSVAIIVAEDQLDGHAKALEGVAVP